MSVSGRGNRWLLGMRRRVGRMYMRGWWEECGWGMSSCVVGRRRM